MKFWRKAVPAFLQNSRRLSADVRLFEEAFKVLQEQNKLDTVMPMLENRLLGMRDKTDSRLLTAKLYLMLNRNDEAKALVLELSLNPTDEIERRQMTTTLLMQFGMYRELEAMNRLLSERKN